jgi:starvation-inducible DNA-binding protein
MDALFELDDMGMEPTVQLSDCLAEVLSDAVVLYYKAKGHHWNVMGNDFAQFHAFFEEIAEDVDSSIDPLAENMRKIGAFSPFRLSEFAQLTSIKDVMTGTNAMEMCKDLYDSNEQILVCLKTAFKCAGDADERGIENFIAERIDMHKKWAWQLNAFISSETTPAITVDGTFGNACPECGMAECNCKAKY